MAELVRQGTIFARRNFWTIAFFTVLAMGFAIYQTSKIQRLYDSRVLLLVERPAANPIEEESSRSSFAEAGYVDGQIFVIRSPDVLSIVLDRANLREDPAFLPTGPSLIDQIKQRILPQTEPEPQTATDSDAAALRKLTEAISVGREGSTNVISIKVRTNSAEKAALIANTIAEEYILNRQNRQTVEASRVAVWLEDRAIELQRQLFAAEDAVAAFKAENDLVEGARGDTLSDQRLFELNAELIRTRTQLSEMRAGLDNATGLLDSGGDLQSLPQVQESKIVGDLRAAKLALQRRENDLVAQTGSNDRRLPQVRDQIAEVDRQITDEIGRIIQVLRNQVATMEAREGLLASSVAVAGGQSGQDAMISVQLRELERVADATRTLYQRYVTSAGLEQETSTFLSTGSEIISRAAAPRDPAYPPVKVIVLIAMIFGAGAGTLIALLREWNREGFMTVAQIEDQLGQRVLARMPKLKSGTNAMDAVYDAPYSPFAEATQMLRHDLLSHQSKGRGAVVLMTSAAMGDGKTFLTSALAASASATGRSILLVDADFRRAGLTRLFKATGEFGLSDILADPKQSYTRPQGKGAALDIIPAGRKKIDSADRFESTVMDRFIADAREDYDLVILDGPPVGNMVDATVLARHADTVAFVVRWNATPRDVAREALRRLPRDRIGGVVLNGFDPKTMAAYGESYDQYQILAQSTPLPRRAAFSAA